MKAVIPLVWIDLLRTYASLFQINRILTTADNKFNLSFNMFIVVMIIAFQIVFISRVILKNLKEKTKLIFYVSNIMILFFGLINKLIGWEKAWQLRGVILMNFVLMSLVMSVFICTMNSIDKCEEKELKYD